MKFGKRLTAAVLLLALALGLAACGPNTDKEEKNEYTAADAAALVRGNLDELYLGTFTPEYLASVDSTQREAEEVYRSSMAVQAEYILFYYRADFYHSASYSYNFVTDEQRDRATELCKRIFAKAKYTVGAGEKKEDGSFTVPVTFQPIDVHVQVDTAWEKFYSDFVLRVTDGVDTSVMSDEEFDKWLEEDVFPAWNDAILDLVESKIDTIGYGKEETINIGVAKDTDGYYVMNQENYDDFDSKLVTFP